MAGNNGSLDEYAMVEYARKTLTDLKKRWFSPIELNRMKTSLREGKVGEVYILSGLLKTVLNEICPMPDTKSSCRYIRGWSIAVIHSLS